MAKELQKPEGFTINPYYEKLLELRKTAVRAFMSISPASKLALLEYERQKRRADEDKAGMSGNLPPAA